jgi:flagellar biosynthesis protein FlhF
VMAQAQAAPLAAKAAAPIPARTARPAPPAEGEATVMPTPAPRPSPAAMAAAEMAKAPAMPAPLPATNHSVVPSAAAMPVPVAPSAPAAPVALVAAAAPIAPIVPVAAAPAAAADSQVMSELRALRAALSDRISALETNLASTMSVGASGAAAQPPFERNAASTRVMTRLLMSGFSPEMARKIAQHAPATRDLEATDSWLHQVIAGNLRCATATESLTEIRGAVALVGPTGVGKTTTVAKLASRFAVRYGVAQLGLVTLDSYRIGAHDQLRGYSRILGLPMHVAQDGATLRELLASLQAKRLVLIDTCGLSQRDERMLEMMAILRAARFNGAPLRPVLLLNAASNAETLDEVARAWNAQQAAGAVLTKLDEAARIGGAVDSLLRYRMMLFGLTNGQRVPEDWHQAGASLIAHVALKPSSSPFALADAEAQAWSEQPQGSMNA